MSLIPQKISRDERLMAAPLVSGKVSKIVSSFYIFSISYAPILENILSEIE